jgi:hypothetical protein
MHKPGQWWLPPLTSLWLRFLLDFTHFFALILWVAAARVSKLVAVRIGNSNHLPVPGLFA